MYLESSPLKTKISHCTYLEGSLPTTPCSYELRSPLITHRGIPCYACTIVSENPQFRLVVIYAMILTLLPCAFRSILSPSLAALASMDPEGGTDAVITSVPVAASAAVIPRQY